MKRLLALVLFAAVAAGAAHAVPTIRLVVPIEVSGLPAPVTRGAVQCIVSRGDSYDATRILGEGRTDFAIEGGRYSGRLGVDIEARGLPAGVDGTLEARSYTCSLFLQYRCDNGGDGEGWCTTGAGGVPTGASAEAVAAMFATDPARRPTGRISGQINRTRATTLPIYR